MAREKFKVADGLRNAVFEDLDFLRLQIADNLEWLLRAPISNKNSVVWRRTTGPWAPTLTTSRMQETPQMAEIMRRMVTHGLPGPSNNGTIVVPIAFARIAGAPR